MSAVRSLEGCGQSKAGGGSEEAGDVAVPLAAEVVDLVEDDQPEPVAEFVGPQVRRVVRRDRDRRDALDAAAELADLDAGGRPGPDAVAALAELGV